MKTIILLAMHGMPPKDFPAREKAEFFRLAAVVERGEQPASEEQKARFFELDRKMRHWPRHEGNDAFYCASQTLKDALARSSGQEVMLGFNEFCAPDLPEALDAAAQKKPGKIVVITPMVTRGGNHSEVEIPEIVNAAKAKYPEIEFVYAWPYADDLIADFLARQVRTALDAAVLKK